MSPPPDRSTVAPSCTSIVAPCRLTRLLPALSPTSRLPLPPARVSWYTHDSPSFVLPKGTTSPVADTEVRLPGLSSSRVPAFNSMSPNGALIVPPCTMVSATSAMRPPAEYTSPAVLPLLATEMEPPATGVPPSWSATDSVKSLRVLG